MTFFIISKTGLPSIAWPVLSTQWHWTPAKRITLRDGAISAAEGHLWSRLVIFGHVVLCQQSSFQKPGSRIQNQHDIFQNFKNLSSCLPSKARTNAKLLVNVRRRRRVAFCRLLPALQSPAGHTRTRRRKNRRRRVRSTAHNFPQNFQKWLCLAAFGCVWLCRGACKSPESSNQNPDSTNPSPQPSAHYALFTLNSALPKGPRFSPENLAEVSES
jgi:hypothetical protein